MLIGVSKDAKVKLTVHSLADAEQPVISMDARVKLADETSSDSKQNAFISNAIVHSSIQL